MFVVCAHGDIYRQMMLLSRHLGMERGEYVFIFFNVLKGDTIEGDFSWRRGDKNDQVMYEPRHEKTCLRGFRPGFTQIEMYNHRIWKEA